MTVRQYQTISQRSQQLSDAASRSSVTNGDERAMMPDDANQFVYADERCSGMRGVARCLGTRQDEGTVYAY